MLLILQGRPPPPCCSADCAPRASRQGHLRLAVHGAGWAGGPAADTEKGEAHVGGSEDGDEAVLSAVAEAANLLSESSLCAKEDCIALLGKTTDRWTAR
jgi:hypothetical protein